MTNPNNPKPRDEEGSADQSDIAKSTLIIARWTRFLGFFTAALVVVGGLQLWNLLSNSSFNEKSFIETQRASIVYAGMQFGPHITEGSTEIDFYFSPVWTNVGNTPAKHFKSWFNDPVKSVSQIERIDARVPKEAPFVPIIIAPKAARNGALKIISVDDLRAVGAGKLHIYLWGDGYYEDRLSPKSHSTKFCEQIASVAWVDPKKIEAPTILFTPCVTHNCIDEECETDQ
jgi:hypothetical protein